MDYLEVTYPAKDGEYPRAHLPNGAHLTPGWPIWLTVRIGRLFVYQVERPVVGLADGLTFFEIPIPLSRVSGQWPIVECWGVFHTRREYSVCRNF